ncbi:protocatechuate 3,4-dioxygenase subunit beta [Leeuwenhoekiella sp. NPDC079379]|uniref:protocatechuate 3,4-dioxygenase subunit beta n=1 Tax=Leeuwenhoekiella sp. NPDC079379 TaxID=3364122 RepID=UPI0037C77E51
MSSSLETTFDRNLQPPYRHEEYKSTLLRAPAQALVVPKRKEIHLNGPLFKDFKLDALDHDLTKNSIKDGEPIGERIVVHGKVTNEKGQPLPFTLIELWQANAAGRYVHKVDQHNAPLDPNFLGTGRCMTDAQGYYKFYTIKPGAYPWGNHPNAWRPNHIHFSLFGGDITSRLITQMYFPGDPLFKHDPIFNAVPQQGRDLLVSSFDLSITEPNFALGYRFDIVLRGKSATPFENI